MQNHSTAPEAHRTGNIDVDQQDRVDEHQGRLLWIGGNIGLGDDATECYFTIEENGARSDWTIAETLARIDDFSELARTRILVCCTHQVRYDTPSDQRSPAASSTRTTSP